MLAFLLSIISMITALSNLTKGTVHIVVLIISLIIIGIEITLMAIRYKRNKFKVCYFGKTHLILKVASIAICIALVSWQYLYVNRDAHVNNTVEASKILVENEQMEFNTELIRYMPKNVVETISTGCTTYFTILEIVETIESLQYESEEVQQEKITEYAAMSNRLQSKVETQGNKMIYVALAFFIYEMTVIAADIVKGIYLRKTKVESKETFTKLELA